MIKRLKAQRPEECLKHIVVVLDPGPPRCQLPLSPDVCVLDSSMTNPFLSIAVLLQMEGGGQLLGALQAMECSCVIEVQAIPRSITWRRRRTELVEVELLAGGSSSP